MTLAFSKFHEDPAAPGKQKLAVRNILIQNQYVLVVVVTERAQHLLIYYRSFIRTAPRILLGDQPWLHLWPPYRRYQDAASHPPR